MDELFKEIYDSRRIRSHGNTTYLKDGRLFANEKILRGYEDFEKLNLDPQLHQIFKPIRKLFCTFLLI